MKKYFDNRKPRPKPLRQTSRKRFEGLADWTFLIDPSSKRGGRWRFRILCVLAVLVALFVYYVKFKMPESAGGIDELIRGGQIENSPGEMLLRNR